MATIRLGSGNDTRNGTNGADSMYGGAGNDLLRGKNGNDRIFGELGNDRIYGDAGNDTMNGGDGTDSVYGGLGADNIGGGFGNDRLDVGADTSRDVANFVVDTASNSGLDTLYNFDQFEDRINLGRFGTFGDLDTNGDGVVDLSDEYVHGTSTNLTVEVGYAFGANPNDQLTVVGVQELYTSDFLFV